MTAAMIRLSDHHTDTATQATRLSSPAVVVPFISRQEAALALRDKAIAGREAAQVSVAEAMARVVAAKRRGAQRAEVAALTTLWRQAKIAAAVASADAGRAALRVA